MGKSCGKILRENLAENSCGKCCGKEAKNLVRKAIWKLAGKGDGEPTNHDPPQENLAGTSCGKFLREILTENSYGKILWEILAENLARNC